MNLANATSQALIFLDQNFETREEVFEFMTQKLYEQGKISDSKSFLKAIYDREQLSVTGFENGLAIPHGNSSAVLEASFAVVRLRSPLQEYPSLDANNQVSLIFMLAIPDSEAGSTHLDILAKLAGRLSDSDYLERFKKAKEKSEILSLLDEKEEQRSAVDAEKGLILGITACAAGIAHTYMAAESLTKTANQLGYKARIEKQGAKGIEDRITAKEVNEAVGIILAHDVSLKGMERFANIPKIDTTVAEPIKHPEEIINRLLVKAEGFIPSSDPGEDFTELDESAKSVKQQIKDSILTGISYIIPIIIAGGMISTVAVLITQIFGLQDLVAVEGSWLFLLKGLGGGLLGSLMIPVLSGYMAYSIADKPGLTPGFAGWSGRYDDQ